MPFDLKTKQLIFQRDRGYCQMCWNRFQWHQVEIHHIHSEALGGQSVVANGQVLCTDCHKKTSSYGASGIRQIIDILNASPKFAALFDKPFVPSPEKRPSMIASAMANGDKKR